MVTVRSLRTGIKYKETPIGKIPVDWEVVKLQDVVTQFYNGGTPATKVREYWDGKLPWITGADFENKKIGRVRKYITDLGVKNSATNVIPKGNLLVVTRTGVGKIAITPFDVAISQDITGIITDSQKTTPGFLYWYFNYNENKLRSAIQGTSINGILRDDLASLLVGLPPLKEQKNVAQILTTLEESIEQTDKIIEKTKKLKKGLVQILLTRGIGHKKFKITALGKIPKEWKVGKLSGIVANFYNGGTPDTKEKGYWDGNIPWITGADFVDQKVGKIRRYITGEGVKSSATNVIPKGNLLIVTRTGVGKLALAPFDVAISQDITGVSTDAKKMRPDFLYWFLYSKDGQLKSLMQGTSISGVLREDLAALPICIPSLEEQENISRMLFTIDHQIDSEIDNKRRLEFQKKSLMQVLLTGKVRVQ